MLIQPIGVMLLITSLGTLAADTGPTATLPPIQAAPQLPALQPQTAPAQPIINPAANGGQTAAAQPLPTFIAPKMSPPPKQVQTPLQVDWGDLALLFRVSDAKMERRVDTDVIGTASIGTYFSFEVSAIRRFANTTIFSGRFLDGDGNEILSMPLEFTPSPFEWRPGTHARAYLLMPEQMDNVRSLVFGTLF